MCISFSISNFASNLQLPFLITFVETVFITFLTAGSLMHTIVLPKTSYFTINGMNASRKQFPLQNCFALAVHKCQGLTLPNISLFLDDQFFAPGQAYTALSHAPSWNAVKKKRLFYRYHSPSGI